jgi:hypothetical protein
MLTLNAWMHQARPHTPQDPRVSIPPVTRTPLVRGEEEAAAMATAAAAVVVANMQSTKVGG